MRLSFVHVHRCNGVLYAYKFLMAGFLDLSVMHSLTTLINGKHYVELIDGAAGINPEALGMELKWTTYSHSLPK